ncbi:hypothetical protein BC830DRAFT_1167452 [Chytriomyces sp. MP71]|nr:hypothetical protein BC830DRAFT_1167452 [Chytriomyces sp. MP71]
MKRGRILTKYQALTLGKACPPVLWSAKVQHLYSTALDGALADSNPEPSQTYEEFAAMEDEPNEDGTGRFQIGQDGRFDIAVLVEKDFDGTATSISDLCRFLEAFFGLPVAAVTTALTYLVTKGRVSLVDQAQQVEFPLKVSRRKENRGAVDAFTIFDVISEYLPATAYASLFVSSFPIFDPTEPASIIGGRACGDRLAVLSAHSPGGSQRSLFLVAVHELCHTLGIDHCEAWHCLMNPCTPERDEDAALELCPADLMKLMHAVQESGRASLDLIKRWELLRDLCAEFGWTKDFKWFKSRLSLSAE